MFSILSGVPIRRLYQLAYLKLGFIHWHRHLLNPSCPNKARPFMRWLSYALETSYQCLPHSHREHALSDPLLAKAAYPLGCSTLVQKVLACRVLDAVHT